MTLTFFLSFDLFVCLFRIRYDLKARESQKNMSTKTKMNISFDISVRKYIPQPRLKTKDEKMLTAAKLRCSDSNRYMLLGKSQLMKKSMPKMITPRWGFIEWWTLFYRYYGQDEYANMHIMVEAHTHIHKNLGPELTVFSSNDLHCCWNLNNRFFMGQRNRSILRLEFDVRYSKNQWKWDGKNKKRLQ